MSNRIVHFEIHADDCARAIKFYTDVFGWEFIKWEGTPTEYYMLMTAPKDSKEAGINGGLLKRPQPLPANACGSNAYVATAVVKNFDETAEKIMKAGGKVAMEKFDIAGMAWQGYYIDTEGNTFGIHQVKEGAAK